VSGQNHAPRPHDASRPNANAIMVSVSPILVDRQTAAAMMGMSLSTFDETVRPELRVVYVGKLRLIPVRELERWSERNAIRRGGDR
jgi:hypothetical protein